MSNRVRQTYTQIYGTPPQLKEPYRPNTYSGSPAEYVEMLTNSVAAANSANVSAVANPGLFSPILGGSFNPRGVASVASGRGVIPNLP